MLDACHLGVLRIAGPFTDNTITVELPVPHQPYML